MSKFSAPPSSVNLEIIQLLPRLAEVEGLITVLPKPSRQPDRPPLHSINLEGTQHAAPKPLSIIEPNTKGKPHGETHSSHPRPSSAASRKVPSSNIQSLRTRRCLPPKSQGDASPALCPKKLKPDPCDVGPQPADSNSDDETAKVDWKALFAEMHPVLEEQQNMLNVFWRCIQRMEEECDALRAEVAESLHKSEVERAVESNKATLLSQSELHERCWTLQDQLAKANDHIANLQLEQRKSLNELLEVQSKLKQTEAQLMEMLNWKLKTEEDMQKAALRDRGRLHRRSAPMGNVTFIFSEIEGSAKMWAGDPSYAEVAASMYCSILKENLAKFGGYMVQHIGDCHLLAFHQTAEAVRFCLAMQTEMLSVDLPTYNALPIPELADRDLEGSDFPLWSGPRLRMTIHHGQPYTALNTITQRIEYYGPAIYTTAYVHAQGQGGIIVCTKKVHDAIMKQSKVLPRHRIKSWRDSGFIGLACNVEHLWRLVPLQLAERLTDVDMACSSSKPKGCDALPENAAMLMVASGIKSTIGPLAVVDVVIEGLRILIHENVRCLRAAVCMFNNLLDQSLEGLPAVKVQESGSCCTTLMFKSAHPALLALQWCLRLQLTILQHQWPPDLSKHRLCQQINFKQKPLFKGFRIHCSIHSCEVVPMLKEGEMIGTTEAAEVQKVHPLSELAIAGEVIASQQFLTEVREHLHMLDDPLVDVVHRHAGDTQCSVVRFLPSTLAERCHLQDLLQDAARKVTAQAAHLPSEAELWVAWDKHIAEMAEQEAMASGRHKSLGDEDDATPDPTVHWPVIHAAFRQLSPLPLRRLSLPSGRRSRRSFQLDGGRVTPRSARAKEPPLRWQMQLVYQCMIHQANAMPLSKSRKRHVLQHLEALLMAAADPTVPPTELHLPIFGISPSEKVMAEAVRTEYNALLELHQRKITSLSQRLQLAKGRHPREIYLIHKVLRCYVGMLRDYWHNGCSSAITPKENEAQFMSNWMTLCEEVMLKRGLIQKGRYSKQKDLWRDIQNYALDTDQKEHTFSEDTGKLFRSILGLLARFFVKVKAMLVAGRKLLSPPSDVFESPASSTMEPTG